MKKPHQKKLTVERHQEIGQAIIFEERFISAVFRDVHCDLGGSSAPAKTCEAILKKLNALKMQMDAICASDFSSSVSSDIYFPERDSVEV